MKIDIRYFIWFNSIVFILAIIGIFASLDPRTVVIITLILILISCVSALILKSKNKLKQ